MEICSLYPQVQSLCKDYRTDEAAKIQIHISPKDITFEREKSNRENTPQKPPVYPDGYLETLAVYRKISEYMLKQENTLLFHGSAIATGGKAYLFTAASGTGKSTHTRLWREYLGDKAVMVNDDKPLLKITPEGVTVFGTPWNGKHHLGNNIAVPLDAICILERGKQNEIHRISVQEALPMLIQQSYHPALPADYVRYLSLLDLLARKVRFFRLHCNMDLQAAKIACEALTQH